jgi:hypothetical protein
MAGHVARMGEMRNPYKVLFWKSEGKRPLWWPRHRWDDNIEMDFREIVFEDAHLIDLAADRDRGRIIVNIIMNVLVPWQEESNFLSSWAKC